MAFRTDFAPYLVRLQGNEIANKPRTFSNFGSIKTGESQFAVGVSLNIGRCVRGSGGSSLLVRTIVLLHEIQYGVTILHLESDVLDALAVRIDLGIELPPIKFTKLNLALAYP